MRIDFIVVHCTATPEGRALSVSELRQMHIKRGWRDIGYNWVIGLAGERGQGRAENVAGSHTFGYNSRSVGVVYVGGLAADGKTAKDTRTLAQKTALRQLLTELKGRYPKAKIVGHRDLSPDKDGDGKVEPHEWLKQCPCFDAVKEYSDL